MLAGALAAALMVLSPPAPAAVNVQLPQAQDPLDVVVVTMGPGTHPFLKFGHDAIWIRDRQAGTNRVYNFGTFRFDSPRLIFDFLGGRLQYWLSVSNLPGVLAEYSRANRSINLQELALPADVKRALRDRLEVNARPENRAYKYDYFLDNCATRVRDAIDAATGGRLRASAHDPGRFTLRGHALRMTADFLPLYLALDLILGPDVDRPIERWGEMFLPEELARGLAAVTMPDPTGGPEPLVQQEQLAFRSTRPPPLESPPRRAPSFFLAGVAAGLAFVLFGWGAARSRIVRALFGALAALWGLVVGFIGCFLVYVWVFTDHVVAHRNQNILLCAPWSLALVVLGVGVAAGFQGAPRKAFVVSALAFAAVVAAAALKLGIVQHQENGALVAFFMPAWLGLTVALALRASETSRP
jgi:hypothetical protein